MIDLELPWWEVRVIPRYPSFWAYIELWEAENIGRVKASVYRGSYVSSSRKGVVGGCRRIVTEYKVESSRGD